MGTPNRNGHDRNTRSERNLERARPELTEPAIRRSGAFRKDRKGLAGADPSDNISEAVGCFAGIGSIHGEIAGSPKVPTHERHIEQLFFGHDFELVRQVSKHRRYVDETAMISHVDVSASCLD